MAERIRATKSTGVKISRVPVFVTRLCRRKIQIRRMDETKASAENIMISLAGATGSWAPAARQFTAGW
jgi:hypothetical protein